MWRGLRAFELGHLSACGLSAAAVFVATHAIVRPPPGGRAKVYILWRRQRSYRRAGDAANHRAADCTSTHRTDSRARARANQAAGYGSIASGRPTTCKKNTKRHNGPRQKQLHRFHNLTFIPRLSISKFYRPRWLNVREQEEFSWATSFHVRSSAQRAAKPRQMGRGLCFCTKWRSLAA
jgi:hypothetical protein